MTSVYERGTPPDQATARLTDAVKAVCPAEGVSIGRFDDRSTWRLDALPEASAQEIDAAHAVMAAFDPWGAGDDLGALSEADEDEGEQPNVYDDEELAPANLDVLSGALNEESGEAESQGGQGDGEQIEAADDGSGDGPEHAEAEQDEAQADEPVADEAAHGESYPGIAILPDELGARRNAVLAAITTEKLTRLAIAMDPSRADFLAARFADYQNAGALGLPIDDALAADYRAFQEMRDRRDRITNYAMQLEQSALDGDMDRLSAMHAGLGDGWP